MSASDSKLASARKSKPSKVEDVAISQLLQSIERSVNEAVDLAVSQPPRSTRGRASQSSVRTDVRSILQSSSEAVRGILCSQRLEEQDAEAARDLLGHIKTLLFNFESGHDLASFSAASVESGSTAESVSDMHGPGTGAGARSLSGAPASRASRFSPPARRGTRAERFSTGGEGASVEPLPQAGNGDEEESERDVSTSRHRSTSARGPPPTRTAAAVAPSRASAVQAVSPLGSRAGPRAHSRSRGGGEEAYRHAGEGKYGRASEGKGADSPSEDLRVGVGASGESAGRGRMDHLESLLSRTETLLERHLSVEAAVTAERSARAATTAASHALETAHALSFSHSRGPHAHAHAASGTGMQQQQQTQTTGSQSLGASRFVSLEAPARGYPFSPYTTAYRSRLAHLESARGPSTGTGAGTLDDAASPTKLGSSAAAYEITSTSSGGMQGADRSQVLSNTAREQGGSGSVATQGDAPSTAMAAAVGDAVEVARLRGELAICRQRVAAAQSDADHSRAARDEAEHIASSEAQLRATCQTELSATQQHAASLSSEVNLLQERLTSLQRTLQATRADADAAAAAYRVREGEERAAANDALEAAVRSEREAQEAKRSQQVDEVLAAGKQAVRAVEASLAAEKDAHEASRNRIERLSADLATVEADNARLHAGVHDLEDTLLRVRTEVVQLNSRVAASNNTLAAKDEEIDSLLRDLESAHATAHDMQSALRRQQAEEDVHREEWQRASAHLEARAAAAEAQASESAALNGELTASCERLRGELHDARQLAHAAQEKLAAAESEGRRQVGELEGRLTGLTGRLAALQDDVQSARSGEQSLREALSEAQSALSVSTSRRDASQHRVAELEGQLEAEKHAHQAARAEIAALKESLFTEVNALQQAISRLQAEQRSEQEKHGAEVQHLLSAQEALKAQVSSERAAKEEVEGSLRRETALAREHAQQAERELQANDKLVSELRDTLERSQREVVHIESARNQATERASKLVGELETAKGRLAGEREAAETALADADAEIQRLATRLADAEQEIRTTRERVDELSALLEESESRRQVELSAAQRAANEDAAYAFTRLTELEERDRESGDRVATVEAALAGLQGELSAANELLKAEQRKCESLDNRLRDAEDRSVRYQRERDEAQRRATDTLAKSSLESSSLISSLREEVTVAKSEAIKQTIRADGLHRQVRDVEASMRTLEGKLNDTAADHSRSTRQVDAYSTERDDARRQLNAVTRERDALMKQIHTLSADVARLNALNANLHSTSANVESVSRERQDALTTTLSTAEQSRQDALLAAARAESERAAASARAQQLEATVRQLAAELAFHRAKDEARQSSYTAASALSTSYLHGTAIGSAPGAVLTNASLRAISPSRLTSAVSHRPFLNALSSYDSNGTGTGYATGTGYGTGTTATTGTGTGAGNNASTATGSKLTSADLGVSGMTEPGRGRLADTYRDSSNTYTHAASGGTSARGIPTTQAGATDSLPRSRSPPLRRIATASPTTLFRGNGTTQAASSALPSFREQYLTRTKSPTTARVGTGGTSTQLRSPSQAGGSGGAFARETVSSSLKRAASATPAAFRATLTS